MIVRHRAIPLILSMLMLLIICLVSVYGAYDNPTDLAAIITSVLGGLLIVVLGFSCVRKVTKGRLILFAVMLIWTLAIIVNHVSEPGFHNVGNVFHRLAGIAKDLAPQVIWLILLLNLSVRINDMSARRYSISPFLTTPVGVYVYLGWYSWPGLYYREACLKLALVPFQVDADGKVFSVINLDFYLGLATVLSNLTLNTCRIGPSLALAALAVIASAGLIACYVAIRDHYAANRK